MPVTQTTTCTKRTVDRWYSPDAWGVWGAPDPNPVDPGPYLDGETVECRACGETVAVTHRITNRRETGTQYVGNLAAH